MTNRWKDEMQQHDVAIIGGGAAGLTAAIASARLGATVLLLEAGPRVGKKILVSGNGRCNLTNLSAGPEAFNRPEFVAPVLRRHTCGDICGFFGDLGLLTRADAEGRVYPTTNTASSVLDVLRLECAHRGAVVRCGFEARGIAQLPGAAGGFEITSGEGETERARTVLVATGGGDTLLGALGHTLLPTSPVLGPIRTDTDPIRGLSGVRVRCAATLYTDASADGAGGSAMASERGELLFRDYGLSGIMVFDLSRFLTADSVISLDFFPDMAATDLESLLSARRDSMPWRTAETFFTGMLHDRVARAVLRAAGVHATVSASELPLARLSGVLKDFRVRARGMGDAAQSQVTRGGASVSEFDPETMASRRVQGLFAAGEALDVDGRSGGFNLHWAWASGLVAGEAAARQAAAGAGRPGAGGCLA